MPRTIRFHLDENCDPAIAAGLRLHGVDVTTTAEAHLLRAEDGEHLTFGMATGRVVFTQDKDFLRLHATGVEHFGIAFCYQQSRSIGQIIASLLLIWEIYEPEEMTNRVEFISSRRLGPWEELYEDTRRAMSPHPERAMGRRSSWVGSPQ